MHNPPNIENLKISSFEEATEIIKLLLLKIQEIEERKPVRDQGLIEEILYLRKETHEGFQDLRKETHEGFQGVNQRLDELTLQSKTHTKILETHSTILQGVLDKLDEISKKLG